MKDNFFEKVYDVVRLVPKGKVTTYGQIAKFLGHPRMSRQVGWALHQNPYPGDVPCHRVVFADGSLARGFAFGGEGEQQASRPHLLVARRTVRHPEPVHQLVFQVVAKVIAHVGRIDHQARRLLRRGRRCDLYVESLHIVDGLKE